MARNWTLEMEDPVPQQPILTPEAPLLLKERALVLWEALAELPARDGIILAMRYGLDGQGERSLEETGRALGITKERARQLQSRAEKKLRRMPCLARVFAS